MKHQASEEGDDPQKIRFESFLSSNTNALPSKVQPINILNEQIDSDSDSCDSDEEHE